MQDHEFPTAVFEASPKAIRGLFKIEDLPGVASIYTRTLGKQKRSRYAESIELLGKDMTVIANTSPRRWQFHRNLN